MYCKKCGKQIEDNSSFCKYCGDRIGVLNINGGNKHRTQINFRVIIGLIALIILLIISVSTNSKETYIYHIDWDGHFETTSADVSLTPINEQTYEIKYMGGDLIKNWSLHYDEELSFDAKMTYEYTQNGFEYFSTNAPGEYGEYMWALSEDKTTMCIPRGGFSFVFKKE